MLAFTPANTLLDAGTGTAHDTDVGTASEGDPHLVTDALGF